MASNCMGATIVKLSDTLKDIHKVVLESRISWHLLPVYKYLFKADNEHRLDFRLWLSF